MSQIGPSPPSNLTDGLPVTSLTLLVLLLIPCVVLLLLLNCVFLGYKLLILSRKNRKGQRGDSENTLLHSTISTRQRMTRIGLSDAPSFPNQGGKRTYVSVSEPMLAQPVTSSRTSSKEMAAMDQGIRFLRPDGATGVCSGSLRAPSTILATLSTTGSASRVDQPRKLRMYSKSQMGWCRSAPVLAHSSDSEVERPHLVPPNSPCVIDLNDARSRASAELGPMRRSSTLDLQKIVSDSPEHLLDKVEFECEYASSIPPESSCIMASINSVGPGLDSDFGASAGVSLRILSADSDGLCNSMWPSALEWDYYDPSYVRQNNIPKHKHRPAVHTKQYWV